MVKQEKLVKWKNRFNGKLGYIEKVMVKWKNWLNEKLVKWKNWLNGKTG